MDAFDASLEGLSEAQLRKVMESCTRDKGPYHSDTIQATFRLVRCLICEDKNVEGDCLPLARRALEHSQRMVGSTDHVDLLPHMINLATCLQCLRQYEEAERLIIKILDITQRARGPEDYDTIQCCHMLATCQALVGKHTEAEALHRRVVGFNTRLLGELDPHTIIGIRELGQCLMDMGKVEEGASTLHRALELYIRAHGMRHYDTIVCMLYLGRALKRKQDYVQAERVLRRVIEFSSDDLELQKIPKLSAMVVLADTLGSMGKHDEGEVMARRALQECTCVMGPGDELTLSAGRLVQRFAPPAVPPSPAGNNGGRRQGGSSSRARR